MNISITFTQYSEASASEYWVNLEEMCSRYSLRPANYRCNTILVLILLYTLLSLLLRYVSHPCNDNIAPSVGAWKRRGVGAWSAEVWEREKKIVTTEWWKHNTLVMWKWPCNCSWPTSCYQLRENISPRSGAKALEISRKSRRNYIHNSVLYYWLFVIEVFEHHYEHH